MVESQKHESSESVPPGGGRRTAKKLAGTLLPTTSGAIGGAIVGLGLGGPVGALAGAAVSPVLTELAQAVQQRRAQRAQETLQYAASAASTPLETLRDRIMEDEDRLDLAIAVLTASADASLHAKRAALGRVLGKGTSDKDRQLGRYLNMARALAILEESHIQVLALVNGGTDPRTWTPQELEDALDESADSLRPVVRQLELHGLITDLAWQPEYRHLIVAWSSTALGRECLALLSVGSGDGLPAGES